MSNPFLHDNPFTRGERDLVVDQILGQHSTQGGLPNPFGSPLPLSSTSSAATGGSSAPRSLPTTASPPTDEIPLNNPAYSGTQYGTQMSGLPGAIYPSSASWSANGSPAGE